MDFEKKVFYLETHKTIENISHFIQFIQTNHSYSKLITLIGEYHEHKKTSNQQIKYTINDFILDCLREFPEQTTVYMEYNSEFSKPEHINSHSIKEVYKCLEKLSLINLINPFDCRQQFISKQDLRNLYSRTFFGLSRKEILNIYVLPYFTVKREILFDIDENDYTKETKIILISYQKKINDMMKSVKHNIDTLQIRILHEKIKQSWLLMTDYFVLKEIFKLEISDFKHEIVIAGIKHTENIESCLEMCENVEQLKHKTSELEHTCIPIYKFIKI
jgi:hypothetical protein